jgi:RimJ/RimL family protein N-acetyltransferase
MKGKYFVKSNEIRGRSMIETTRLSLVQMTPQAILTLIDAPDDFTAVFGYDAGPGLRDFFVGGDVSEEWLAELRRKKLDSPWDFGYALVHREYGTVIGTAGFKGPPDGDGTVEIAYAIVPIYENQGYATEAARALTEFAIARDEVRHVIAHTLPENNASTHVLRRCGYAFDGEVIDPEDGPVWRWTVPTKKAGSP